MKEYQRYGKRYGKCWDRMGSLFRLEEDEWDHIKAAIERRKNQWETPFYLFSETKARKNVAALRRYMGSKVKMAYAMKANPWLVKSLSEDVDYIEVCSEGELEICRRHGVPGEKIVLGGVYKGEGMIEKAFGMNVERFCIDSKEQLEGIIQSAVFMRKHAEVLLRMSSGNQFGMEEAEAEECARMCWGRGYSLGNVEITGIQYYPGTQRSSIRQIQKEIQRLDRWIEWLEEHTECKLNTVEFGAGLGVSYFENEDMEEYEEALRYVSDYARELSERYLVVYEAGRIVAAASGIYVTQVFARKRKGEKTVLFCKGGTNHLSYHGGILGIRTPVVKSICADPYGEAGRYMICGSLCNEGDVMGRDIVLPERNIGPGDSIAFFNAGAYSATASPNLFLAMEMPAVLMYNQDNDFMQEIRGHFPTYELL